MALGGEMHQGIDGVFAQDGHNQVGIVDVPVHKAEARQRFEISEAVAVAGIAEGVEDDQGVIGMLPQPVVAEVGADEAGTAGDQEALGAVGVAGSVGLTDMVRARCGKEFFQHGP